MNYIYVFLLMFFSIFGLAMLLELFARALLDSSFTAQDVYIRCGEDIEEFVRFARKSGHIRSINLIPTGTSADETAAELAKKYDDVHIVSGIR